MQENTEPVTTGVGASAPVAGEAVAIGVSEKDQDPLPKTSIQEPTHPPKRSKLKLITIVAACTGTQILNVGVTDSIWA